MGSSSKTSNMKVLIILGALLACAHGRPDGIPIHAPVYKEIPAHYSYEYAVHDDYHGTNFGHHEARDGYATQGEYHVALPDGRIQTVTYHVDDAYGGYIADVKYSGHAAPYHPAAPIHAAPAYHAAPAAAVVPIHL